MYMAMYVFLHTFIHIYSVSMLLYYIWLRCLQLCGQYRYNKTLVAVLLLILYSSVVYRYMNKLM